MRYGAFSCVLEGFKNCIFERRGVALPPSSACSSVDSCCRRRAESLPVGSPAFGGGDAAGWAKYALLRRLLQISLCEMFLLTVAEGRGGTDAACNRKNSPHGRGLFFSTLRLTTTGRKAFPPLAPTGAGYL